MAQLILLIGQSGPGDGQFDTPQGVAVAGTGIYVADYGNSRIEQFSGAGGGSLDVTTGSTHAITGTSAMVTGLVDPNGTDASYWFEYGTTSGYGSQTTADDAGTDNGFVGEADLTGLSPATIYHYRIVVQQGLGSPVDGADRTFTTAASAGGGGGGGPSAPAATTGGTNSVGATVATVSANGADTTYHFDLGKSTTAFASLGTTDIGTADGYAASFDATGLGPATTYDYRVVAIDVWNVPQSLRRAASLGGCPCSRVAVKAGGHTSPTGTVRRDSGRVDAVHQRPRGAACEEMRACAA
jgi:phosphodiesterase/alkaline phosphatase D-like protein